jgi:hypothetical protein
MLHDRLVSALVKDGATVTEEKSYFCMSVSDHSRAMHKRFRAEKNGKHIVWSTQENFNEKLGANDGRLYVSFVTQPHPDTNAMYDYFADTYEHTIKGAVHLLNS